MERQPFGGAKMSGVGSKVGGPDCLLQFMDPRVVTENTIRRGFTPIEEGDDWFEECRGPTIIGALVERQAFGGARMSGAGSKAGGPDCLLQFMDPRVVTENTIRRGFTPIEEGDDWFEECRGPSDMRRCSGNSTSFPVVC